MAKANKSMYTAVALLIIVVVWALMFYWPTPQLDAAVKRMTQEEAGAAPTLDHVRLTLHLYQDTAVVTFANEGREAAFLPDEARGRAYRLLVTGEKGLSLEKAVSPMPVESAVMVSLLPGTAYQRRFDLGRILRLQPGSYHLQVIYSPAAVNRKYRDLTLGTNTVQYVVTEGPD